MDQKRAQNALIFGSTVSLFIEVWILTHGTEQRTSGVEVAFLNRFAKSHVFRGARSRYGCTSESSARFRRNIWNPSFHRNLLRSLQKYEYTIQVTFKIGQSDSTHETRFVLPSVSLKIMAPLALKIQGNLWSWRIVVRHQLAVVGGNSRS